jgi:DNA-binding NtrC family response regulator
MTRRSRRFTPITHDRDSPTSTPADGATTPYGRARQGALRGFEVTYFSELLRAFGGNVSEMARRSGMEGHHVRPLLEKHGLGKMPAC